MAKTVLLVGHCIPDSSYLKNAVRRVDRQAEVHKVDDPETLAEALAQGADLVLFNRKLGYDFDGDMGVDWIRRLKAEYPALKMMLVSNFPEAQAEAEKAGAIPGFGKREIGTERVKKLLGEVLAAEVVTQ